MSGEDICSNTPSFDTEKAPAPDSPKAHVIVEYSEAVTWKFPIGKLKSHDCISGTEIVAESEVAAESKTTSRGISIAALEGSRDVKLNLKVGQVILLTARTIRSQS
ncbi:hypothetical protein E4U53_002106 [Claviceps sorghi]|nr:hypothetical protein E4U53_002106 [Claviceps sorghi]